MERQGDIDVIYFPSHIDWGNWLEQHHDREEGVWIKFAKKDSGIPSITYAQALDIALCYGWIDGHRKSYDDKYFIQRFTKRRRNSSWSDVNVKKVESLQKAGRMQPSGLREVARAKEDGRWDLNKNHPLPDDFASALNANKRAEAFFASLTNRQQQEFIWSVLDAKRSETRKARIKKFVLLLESHNKLY